MRQLAFIAVLLVAGSAAAADAEHGKALHDQFCTKCHGSGVYTREDRFVRDMQGLDKQVRRCHLSAGAQWSDEDINDVVAYLNSTYYHFK
jgi:mono/diheme cytochrome c family protein